MSEQALRHAVCGWRDEKVAFITVYIPRPPKFFDPWTRGKKEDDNLAMFWRIGAQRMGLPLTPYALREHMMEYLFWLSATLAVYGTVGYPAFIWVLAKLAPKPVRQGDILPTVTCVITTVGSASLVGLLPS